MAEDVKKPNNPIFIVLIIIGIFIVVGIVIGLSSTGNVLKEDGETYKTTQKNCKDIKVPYEVTETYIEQEPYQGFEDVEVTLKYEQSGEGRDSYSELFNVRYKGIVMVKNVDSETGYFRIIMNFVTLNDGTVTEETGGYVQAGETKEFDIYYDIDAGEDVNFGYNVIPGKKTVTKPVTKYKSIEKTRVVTKYKTEEQCN